MEQPNLDEKIGSLIKQQREDKGWTQGEYAARLSEDGPTWHQQTILKVEKGTRPLRVTELVRHAEVLGIPAPGLLQMVVGQPLPNQRIDDDKAEPPVMYQRAMEATARTAQLLQSLEEKQQTLAESIRAATMEQKSMFAALVQGQSQRVNKDEK